MVSGITPPTGILLTTPEVPTCQWFSRRFYNNSQIFWRFKVIAFISSKRSFLILIQWRSAFSSFGKNYKMNGQNRAVFDSHRITDSSTNWLCKQRQFLSIQWSNYLLKFISFRWEHLCIQWQGCHSAPIKLLLSQVEEPPVRASCRVCAPRRLYLQKFSPKWIQEWCGSFACKSMSFNLMNSVQYFERYKQLLKQNLCLCESYRLGVWVKYFFS